MKSRKENNMMNNKLQLQVNPTEMYGIPAGILHLNDMSVGIPNCSEKFRFIEQKEFLTL